MQVGIDARLVFYSNAGIGQYIIHLTKALAEINTPTINFSLLQSRKDRTAIVQSPKFKRASLWTPSHHRLEQPALRFETARLGLDLLHSPDFIPPFKRNYKSVITVHDLAFLLYPQFMTKEAARYYGQIDQAVRSTDHIIAVSHATKQDLSKQLGVPDEKVSVIYEGINPHYNPMDKNKAAAAVEKRWGLEPGFIFFLSTLEPRKNVPNLLKAYHMLRQRYKSKVKLVLAGKPGWLFEEIDETVQQLQLEKDAIFLGRVTDQEVNWLYNTASMLVYPSFYEGFGLPPLEAMHCGLPVIASQIKVMPEVVGDAALLVDPHDVESLAISMNRVLSDDTLRQELILKGQKRAAQFSWIQAAYETLQVYQYVVNEEIVEINGWRLAAAQDGSTAVK
jgi:glycosyltransferase involved in cell wall biosynthesis